MGKANGHSSDGPTTKDFICNAVAGASAGAIAATFVCPLDVIKTRLQVHGLPETHLLGGRGSIIVTSLKHILKTEGIRGMYCGLSPTILALLPNWAVYFTVYEQLKGLLHSHDDRSNQLSIGANMIAAAGAGAATSISTNPLWVIKTRLQTQGMRPGVVPYTSIVSGLKRITCEEGVRGLYSGLLPSLAGISHVAIQFPSYEKLKSYLAKRGNFTSSSVIRTNCFGNLCSANQFKLKFSGNTTVDKLRPVDIAIASSMSKVLASVMTYPHEVSTGFLLFKSIFMTTYRKKQGFPDPIAKVIRSRLQEQGQLRNSAIHYAGAIDCMKKVFRKEGLAGFYRGCGTNLLRTTPSAVITFTSFEMIQRFLHRVLPPDENSQSQPSSDGGVRHPRESRTTTSDGDNTVLDPSENPSDKRIQQIPLANKDQLPAGH